MELPANMMTPTVSKLTQATLALSACFGCGAYSHCVTIDRLSRNASSLSSQVLLMSRSLSAMKVRPIDHIVERTPTHLLLDSMGCRKGHGEYSKQSSAVRYPLMQAKFRPRSALFYP
jgi:hypothetical protein